MNAGHFIGWHMGGLHPIETVLVLLLAVGPFLVVGLIFLLRRRRDSSKPPEADDTGVPVDQPDATRR